MAENAGMENSDTGLNIPLFVLFAFSLWSLQSWSFRPGFILVTLHQPFYVCGMAFSPKI